MTPFHQINSYAHAQHPNEHQFGNRDPEIRDAITEHSYSRQCFHGMEITEHNDATSSVTNSIAGLARYNGDKKKPVKKMALLPNLQGN